MINEDIFGGYFQGFFIDDKFLHRPGKNQNQLFRLLNVRSKRILS